MPIEKRSLEATENAVSAVVVVKAKKERVTAISEKQKEYTERRTNVEDTDEEADLSAGELSGEKVPSRGSVSNGLQGPVAHQTPQRTLGLQKNLKVKILH